MKKFQFILILIFPLLVIGCNNNETKNEQIEVKPKSAAEILGNPDYLAMSFGGYRFQTRDTVPTIEDLKEDMRILSAMGVKIIRTYNAQQFEQAANLLKAIKQLKEKDPDFEMYVMLGAWIDCHGAWNDSIETDHNKEDPINNTAEIEATVKMCNQYPDIVKVIAVGNEAMVKWAESYYVQADVILKWVNYLQDLKKNGKLPADTWITSSDNFASWGGEGSEYHTEDLAKLVKAVDYLSVHIYPFHDTHYNSEFWKVPPSKKELSIIEQTDNAMVRAKNRVIEQYEAVVNYVKSLGVEKPIHIGETGWASKTNSLYGPKGSGAADEYKVKIYYDDMREWTKELGMSCFYFEAFDEKWKDGGNPLGSENHFGLINLNGEAKYPLWDLVDKGSFEGLTRGGKPITKTYGGNFDKLKADILKPTTKKDK